MFYLWYIGYVVFKRYIYEANGKNKYSTGGNTSKNG